MSVVNIDIADKITPDLKPTLNPISTVNILDNNKSMSDLLDIENSLTSEEPTILDKLNYDISTSFGLDQSKIDVDDIKRRIVDKTRAFPKVTFLIYAIIFLITILLAGYLLFMDSNGKNIPIEIIKWGLFVGTIIIFFINIFLYTQSIPYKKIILIVMAFIQMTTLAIALFLSIRYSNNSDNYFFIYMLAFILNGLTFASSLLPIYFI